MNTARIVVLAIAVGAGGAVVSGGERPDTASRLTGPTAQARPTGTLSPTLQSIADGSLANESGDRVADASSASTSRHGAPAPATR